MVERDEFEKWLATYEEGLSIAEVALVESLGEGNDEAARIASDFLDGVEEPLAALRAALRDRSRPLTDEEILKRFNQLVAEARVMLARNRRLGRKQGWGE
jgi:hypothetical protein